MFDNTSQAGRWHPAGGCRLDMCHGLFVGHPAVELQGPHFCRTVLPHSNEAETLK